MKLKEVYTLFRNACLFHKDINTFCVLTEYNDITKANLNRNITDKSKPYFLSKRWVDSGYDPDNITYELPALFIYEMPFELQDMFSGREKYKHELKLLMLLDSRDSNVNKDHKSDDDHRLDQEQFDTAKYLLYDIFHYMDHYGKIRINNPKIAHDYFITRSEQAVGIEATISFIEKCPESTNYWLSGSRYIIDEDGTILVDEDDSPVVFTDENL